MRLIRHAQIVLSILLTLTNLLPLAAQPNQKSLENEFLKTKKQALKADVQEGYYESLFSNDSKKTSINLKKGLLNGTAKKFHFNGNSQYETTYSNDKLNGTF